MKVEDSPDYSRQKRERRAYLSHDRGGVRPSLVDLVMARTRGVELECHGRYISDLPVRRVTSVEDIPQGRCTPVTPNCPDSYALVTRRRRR